MQKPEQIDVLAVALIDSEERGGDDQELLLIRDGDRYRWVAEDGTDTQVSARTEEEAKQAASEAWRNWTWRLVE